MEAFFGYMCYEVEQGGDTWDIPLWYCEEKNRQEI